jgi:hypothetical protein
MNPTGSSSGKMGGGVIPTGQPPAGTKVTIILEMEFDGNGEVIFRADCWVVRTASLPSLDLGRFTSFQAALNFVVSMQWVP